VIFAFSYSPCPQSILLKAERLHLQSRLLQMRYQFMFAKGRNVKQEESAAPSTKQLTTYSTMAAGVLVNLIQSGISDFAAKLALELPRLIQQLTKLHQVAPQ
jgi:hypothetical protein